MKTKNLLMTLVVSLGFATIIMAQNSTSYAPTNGLESCYSFTGDATDQSAGTNDGVINGATLTAGKDGVSNTAYSFDGISNTINFSSPFLGGTQVSAFSYHARLNVNDISNSPNIWGKTLSWGEVNFSLTSDGEILFKWANNVSGNKYSLIKSDTNIISESTWYDIVVVYQNAGAEIYVNGQPVTTNLEWIAQGGSVLSTTQIDASCNFAQDDNSSKIGARITGGNPGNYFNGIIDEFCIWDSVLTQEEITALYTDNTDTFDACYSFTGDATDQSAGTNDGVINGATLTAGKDGVSNTAYSFDGISNTINFSSPFLGGTQVSAFSYHARLNVNDISNSPNIWGKTLSWGEVNFSLTSDGEILFKWANNVSGNKYSLIKSDTNIISESTWYDIVVVYQNAGAEIYVNGQPVTTNLEWIAQGGSVLSTTQIDASCNFAQDDNSSKIGARITGGNPGNYFNGIIDEFCIWDSVLTQEEITALYTDNTDTFDACYSFTGDATDQSAGTNDGVINGATLTAGKDGVSNTAYSFDGISNTINFSSPFLGGTQVSAFSYHARLNVNDISNSPNIWGKTLSWGEVNFSLTSDGAILFKWANNVSGNKYSLIKSDTNIISESTWYDIVVVYQNAGAEIYVNGQPVTTNLEWIAQGGSVLSTTQIDASCNFAQDDNSSKIGARITGGNPGNYFNGIIDEFCIWDSVLTQEEITALYTDNTDTFDACYSFTGDATDQSAGTNDGVINGATLTAGKDGVSNTAYSFDGISNTINFSSPFLGGTQVSAFSYHARLNVNDISNSPNIWGKTLSWGEVNFSLTSDGAILFKWANNVSGNKYSLIKSDTNIISESTWYDIVVVYQNAGAEIYVNGQPVTTNLEWIAQGGSVLSTTQIDASCNFAQDDNSSKIGVRITGGNPGNYFNGIIDEFCIWDSVLTQEEINEIYNNSSLTTKKPYENEEFEVYPNPVKNYLNLKINSNHIGLKYAIYDSLGNIIISGKINSELNLIDMNNVSNGLYFLKIGNNFNTTYKIIKN